MTLKYRIGDLKSNIKLNRLGKSVQQNLQRAATGEKKRKNEFREGSVDLNERMMNFSFNLDMRGKRGEEAH
jgi:DNA mismatch repair protein MutS2